MLKRVFKLLFINSSTFGTSSVSNFFNQKFGLFRSFFQDLHTKRQFSKLILSKNSKIDSEICCSPRLFVIISMMYVYDSINVQFATTRQTILENVDQNNAFLKSFRSENQILITGKTKYACACSYRPRCNFIEVLK